MAFSVFGANPKTASTSVTTTAARILAAGSQRSQGGLAVKALQSNTDVVYVGGSDVATGNGYPLYAGESVSISVDDPSRVYAVAGSGTQTLRILYL